MKIGRIGLYVVFMAAVIAAATTHAQEDKSVPPDQRGQLDSERSGVHDAANIRTIFWNYGMVGDYPSDPGNVDLSVFHSAEFPKGSGMNYSDGITPFVLAKINERNGRDVVHHGDRLPRTPGEQPVPHRIMRFEPRPGYFEANPNLNPARSPAISNDPRTWPALWPDKLLDPDDPGWAGKWNGYFGKRAAADQESFTVMDDDYYDAWDFDPDSTDSTRRGLGLRDRGAWLPVGEPAGRKRDLLALRHHQRGNDRLRRQHHLRPLHGLGRRRLRALLRRDLRVGRRQRLLRSDLRPERDQPRLHLGQARARTGSLGELRQDRVPRATPTSRRRETPPTGSTTTRTASPTRSATAARAS